MPESKEMLKKKKTKNQPTNQKNPKMMEYVKGTQELLVAKVGTIRAAKYITILDYSPTYKINLYESLLL